MVTLHPAPVWPWLPLILLLGASAPSTSAVQRDPYEHLREGMVERQIESRGVRQPEVLRAMAMVPRHLFVPEARRSEAYEDRPLSIGEGQTISQPYIVARMTELLALDDDDRVLEIGTGSGYHAAVLSRVAGEVWTIEIIPSLAARARRTVEELGYDNIHFRVGDGYRGWPEEAPFDAVILTAAPPAIPPPLLDQLAEGGRLVAPVGSGVQTLQLFVKAADGVVKRDVLPVMFVPMTGEAQRPPRREPPP
jgi:protein-L-isoaspartate(D-aspartate) O-methyltransferase